MKATFALLALLLGLAPHVRAQAWELFENPAPPPNWTVSGANTTVAPDNTRSLQGERSLQWSWAEPSASLTWPLAPAATGPGYLIFSQWIRLETPLPNSHLRVELRSTDGRTRFFDVNLGFTGWRTMFVPYSSMEGDGNNSIDRVRWTLVNAPSSGTLYLDQVIVGKKIDMRFPYADRQVPFIDEDETKPMWENRVHWDGLQPPEASSNLEEILAVRELRQEWDHRLAGSGSVSTATVNQWETRMNAFNVRREGSVVRGNQIYHSNYPSYAYPTALADELAGSTGPNDFRDYTRLMLDLARGWHRTSDETLRTRIAEMVVLMGEHLLDQGWASGSNQGSVNLIGYQIRDYFRALYLAREIFADAGMLEEVGEASRWYGQAGSLFDEDRAPNLDFFNTLAQGQFLSLLMEPDEDVQVAWMRALSDSLTRQISDMRPGGEGGYKPDGTAFHHQGHYPAYAIGGINTLGEIFDVLRGTPFELGKPARMSFRNVLFAARTYSQPLDWPIGISGRHPFEGNIVRAEEAFRALAQYPDPYDGTAPDREIASAYVRLWGQPSGSLGELFADAGIEAESLSGFFSFPFANLAVYRSDDWMVSLKGYSRYVWSSEIYAADNRYGRNQSNGTAEILLSSGRAASGFRENGWDWNRLPGTTSLHLPLAQLESPNAGSLLLSSDETMAGAVTSGRDGVFGFVLNEDAFGHTLTARKSMFAADGMLIAVGTGISSNHATAPAETTLFQVALDGDRAPMVLSLAPGSPIDAFPWDWQATPPVPIWAIDPVGNGFWLPPGQAVRLSRVNQQSRDNKTKNPTTGDFASGWLDHGVGATGETYHYAILPQTSAAEMTAFDDRMKSAEPPYELLRQDESVHAVRVADPDRFGFAIFEPGSWQTLPHLVEAERQSLLWIEEDGTEIVVSMANPDLNFGETENPISPTGFTLRGAWEHAGVNENGALLWHLQGNTKIVFPAREGGTWQSRLQPGDHPSSWSPGSGDAALAPVEHFRAASPTGPFLKWDPIAGDIDGTIVERMLPGGTDFSPIAFLAKGTTEFLDDALGDETLGYYRVRKWGDSGAGSPTHSLLIFNPGTETASYDFTSLSNVSTLTADGWTSSGIESESDWYVAPEGMFLIDNSPAAPATLTLPFAPLGTGRVSARMGVAKMANFTARLELLAGEDSLGEIQLTTRTDGLLRGLADVDFSDTRWDVEQGTLRDVVIEWGEVAGGERLEIILRYLGTTETANAINRWEIPNTPANRPDRIRFSVGFNSAVNRGLVIESLEVLSTAPRSTEAFYRAWADEFLGSPNAAPSGDSNANGIADLWEFILARNPLNPGSPPHRQLNPAVEDGNGAKQFAWAVPQFADTAYRIEATDALDGVWKIVPHLEEPIAGTTSWIRIIGPSFAPEASAHFYRLVLSANLQ